MGRIRQSVCACLMVVALFLFYLIGTSSGKTEAKAGDRGGTGSSTSKRYRAITAEIVDYLKSQNADWSERQLKSIAREVYKESEENNIDYRLILALMKVESNFKHDAVSSKGARGLLQIKPSLGRSVAVGMGLKWRGDTQLHEPDQNIKIGVHHLSDLLSDFGSLPSALGAYNAGPAKAKKKAAANSHASPRFANAVLQEFSKNLSILPDP